MSNPNRKINGHKGLCANLPRHFYLFILGFTPHVKDFRKMHRPATQKIGSTTSKVCGRGRLSKWEPRSPKVTTNMAPYRTSKLFFFPWGQLKSHYKMLYYCLHQIFYTIFLDPVYFGTAGVSGGTQHEIRGPGIPRLSPPLPQARGQLRSAERSSAQTLQQGAPRRPGEQAWISPATR